MMQIVNINFAIKGAITKFQGFGDYIASSSSFEQNTEDIKAVSEIDREFSAIYDSQPATYSELIQYFFFPKSIARRNCYLAVRAKKKFTTFPEQYRFYDRREYFYFNLDSEIDVVEFSTSLPEMRQYESKHLGQSNKIEIKKNNSVASEIISRIIVFSILNQTTLILKISEQNHVEIQNKILASLNRLPTCYKKYLGFGFNIKSDSTFVRSHLHILTTLDENSVDIDSSFPQRLHSNDLFELSELLLNGILTYDDTELKLLNTPLNRETIFELVKYHKLHFKVDKYFNSPSEEANEQDLFSESKNYILTFFTSEFANYPYILKRITCIYKFWRNNGLLNTETFLLFWEKFGELNLGYEKFLNDYEIRESINTFIQKECRSVNSLRDFDNKYPVLDSFPSFNFSGITLLDETKIEFYKQKKLDKTLSLSEINELETFINAVAKKTKIDFQENLLKNVDLNKQLGSLSSLEIFKLLKEKIEQLSSIQIKEIVTAIGITNLSLILQKGSHNKLIQNIDFNVPMFELVVKQTNLNEILRWVLLFQAYDVKLNFNIGHYLDGQVTKINSQHDFYLFDSLCKSISNNKSIFRENDVLSFIEQILRKENCRQMQFYSVAFLVAEIYDVNINCPVPLYYDEKELIQYISFFEQNLKLLHNKKIVELLKAEFFNSFLQSNYSFEEMLRFFEENYTFVSSNANKFSKKLEEIFSYGNDNEKFHNTIVLFNNIIENERNLFLNKNGNLYNYISALEITQKQYIHELYMIGMKINKKKSVEFTEVKELINRLIDKYFDLINHNTKYIKKMKNKMHFIRTSTKILVVCLIFALVGTTIAAVYLHIQNNSLIGTFSEVYQENLALTTENQKLANQLEYSTRKINNNSFYNSAPLSPLPKRELNLHDVEIVNNNIQSGMTIDEVVAVVFKNNPGDINYYYNNQTNAYAVELTKSNPMCFDKGKYNGVPLAHIPSYK